MDSEYERMEMEESSYEKNKTDKQILSNNLFQNSCKWFYTNDLNQLRLFQFR